ncbi:MAG: methyltransferase, partial [Pseudomonadota bacterium]|nr:methyltransferase [Pseudomonadota bacterium]
DIFIASHKVLKKGGVLGVVEHRAIDGTSIEKMKKTGYVTEDYAIKNIEKFGFKLVSKSEINSNPKDTKDHPKGVWTLPPVLRLKDKDQEKYVQIGESDRFTFLFRKI